MPHHVPSPTTLSPHHPTNMLYTPTPHILDTPQGYFNFSYLIQVSNGILKLNCSFFFIYFCLAIVGGWTCLCPPSYLLIFLLYLHFEETAGSVAITVLIVNSSTTSRQLLPIASQFLGS